MTQPRDSRGRFVSSGGSSGGGGGVNLGSAYGSITINDNIDAAIGKATQSFDNVLNVIGGKMQQLGNRMSTMGAQLTVVTAPLAAFGATGIRAAGNFQSALTEIQVRAGLTDEALDEVRKTALRLGADTQFSTQQAADAFLQLLTAGLDSEQALQALPAILDGAAASGADLGTAADLVTNVMSAFNLEASETERIVNAMAQGAGASPATMLQMGEALQQAGGIAGEFNVSLEETAAIMAIFAKRGVRGSEAATQLRSIMTNMTSPTENTAKAWDMLGTSLFEADGSMRNLDEVLGDIRSGMSNLTDEQRAFVTQNLAGSYGRIGFNALLASDGIESMIDAMEGQASASEIAKKKMEDFWGQVTSLKGSIEALLITAFTPFIEMLTPFVKQAIEIVNRITAWIEANKETSQTILKVLAALVVLGPTLIILGQLIAFIGGGISGLGILFAALTSPIWLVIAGGFRRHYHPGLSIKYPKTLR